MAGKTWKSIVKVPEDRYTYWLEVGKIILNYVTIHINPKIISWPLQYLNYLIYYNTFSQLFNFEQHLNATRWSICWLRKSAEIVSVKTTSRTSCKMSVLSLLVVSQTTCHEGKGQIILNWWTHTGLQCAIPILDYRSHHRIPNNGKLVVLDDV